MYVLQAVNADVSIPGSSSSFLERVVCVSAGVLATSAEIVGQNGSCWQQVPRLLVRTEVVGNKCRDCWSERELLATSAEIAGQNGSCWQQVSRLLVRTEVVGNKCRDCWSERKMLATSVEIAGQNGRCWQRV